MDLSKQQRETCKIIDSEYTVESDGNRLPQPIVHLFCRDGDKNRRRIEVEGFRPYFMLSMDEFTDRTTDVINDRHVLAVEGDMSLFASHSDIDQSKYDGAEGVADFLTGEANGTQVYHKPETFEALDGTELVKVFTVEPEHVGKIRDHFDRTWEADVPFTRRFLISSGIHHGAEIPQGADRVRYENWDEHSESNGRIQEISPADPPEIDPHMLVVDIEVATHGGGVPDPADAYNEITAITAYDNYSGEYAGWILESEEWSDEDRDFESAINDRLDMDIDKMAVYDHEAAMVEDFHQWVTARDFDLVTGWNSNGFDYPYIIRRSYNISAYAIRDWDVFGSPFNAGDEWPDPVIEGRVTFDMMEAYKKTQFREMRSYSLDYVAQVELGMGKEQLGEDLDDAWHYHPIDFMVYNVRDVQAVVEIEETAGLLNLYDNLRQVTGALYNTCHHNGPMLDTLFLRQAYDEEIALTTNYEPDQGDYHGAHVFDPVPGVHENVVYPDLASLYPYILWTLNISPETLYMSQEAYREAGFEDDQMFSAYIDTREWKVMSSGETVEPSKIDKDQYKGVHDETGSRKKKQSQGFDGIFDPLQDEHPKSKTEIYFVKPEYQEGFIRKTVDLLVDLKYRYKGQGDMYSAVKRVTNCHTPDTRVLTESGLVPIAEISKGDKVYTLDTDNRELEVETVDRTFEHDYDGEIVDISTTSFEASVTPDHEFPLSMQYSDEIRDISARKIAETASARYSPSMWEFENDTGIDRVRIDTYVDCVVHLDPDCHGQKVRNEFGDGVSYEGSDRKSYVVSEECIESQYNVVSSYGDMLASDGSEYARVPLEYNAENFMELTGWYIAEGYCLEGNTGSKITRITQSNDKKRAEITGLLDEMGIDYSVSSEKDVCISSAVLYRFFTEYCGSGSQNKKIPQFVFEEASQSEMEALFDAMMKGDGHRSDSSEYYSTSSRDLSRDVAHLITLLGNAPKISEVDGGEYGTSYRVTWRNSDTVIRGDSCEIREYTGPVYDIEVGENHTYLFEQEGVISLSHNSIYGVLGDSASGGKGFRLFDWRLAEAITLGGQMVIQYTADEYVRLINEYAEDAEFEPNTYLVGGDTDSVMSSIPSAPDYATALEWAQRASEEVSGPLYDEFMEQEFKVIQGEDEHKMDVEIESLASNLFFTRDWDKDYEVAVKKRYAQHEIWDEDDGWLHPDIEDRSNVSLSDYTDGVLSDRDPTGDIDITGFEYVRSDSATVTQDAQLEVLTSTLLADDPAQEIYDFLSQYVEDIKSGAIPEEDLGRPKGISNPLDDYGWKTYEELQEDTNYTATEEDEQNGGRYVSTPSPTYRGAKYADDHFDWETIGAGSKPIRFYVDKVRGDEYPPAYEYESYPKDNRPDPLEVGRNVDAIAVDNPERVPDGFVLDREKMIDKELKDKLQPILRTIGEDWDGIVGHGRQVGLGQWQ